MGLLIPRCYFIGGVVEVASRVASRQPDGSIVCSRRFAEHCDGDPHPRWHFDGPIDAQAPTIWTRAAGGLGLALAGIDAADSWFAAKRSGEGESLIGAEGVEMPLEVNQIALM
jgi:hypothetical protein